MKDNTLYCQFSRETRSVVKDKTFDLVNDRYQLMIVSGDKINGKIIIWLYHIFILYFLSIILCLFTFLSFCCLLNFAEDSVSFHSKVYVVSESKVSLAEVGEIAGASKLLLRLHGAFMLVAWIGTSSCGILLARWIFYIYRFFAKIFILILQFPYISDITDKHGLESNLEEKTYGLLLVHIIFIHGITYNFFINKF